MKKHRNRSIVLDGETLLFTETEPDTWLCVKEIPSHDAIHRFLKDEKESGSYHIRCVSRSFEIDSRMKDFKELKSTE